MIEFEASTGPQCCGYGQRYRFNSESNAVRRAEKQKAATAYSDY